MPLTIPPAADFTGPSTTEAIFKARLTTLLAELAANATAFADIYGFKNRITNGGFSINQRGLTSVADDVYCLDRWYGLTETGNIAVAQQANQEASQPRNIRLTQPDATAKRIGLAQIIEGVQSQDLRGAALCVSARVRCSSSQAIRWALIEHTGTEDAVTSDLVNNWASGSYTAGGFFIGGVTVNATGSVTPAANTWITISAALTGGALIKNLALVFWSEGTLVQNATLDIGKVQIEAGSVVTPFERRPVGLELSLCQRFAYTMANAAGGEAFGIGHITLATAANIIAKFPVTMRVPPAISFSAASDFMIYSGGSSIVPSAVGGIAPTTSVNTAWMFATISGATVGRAAILAAAVSTGRVYFESEL